MKGEIDHDVINIIIYKDYENSWEHYLIDVVVGLAFVVAKHGNHIQKITCVSSYKNSLTQVSLGGCCLGRYLKKDNKVLYTPRNKDVRHFIKRTVHDSGDSACNKNFESKSFQEVVNVKRFYGKDLEHSVLFEKILNISTRLKPIINKKTELDLMIIDELL